MAVSKPTKVTVRSYQVGFGDCFLLTFHYASRDRHVLIDFGTMSLPPSAGDASAYVLKVANQIKQDCSGKLHAVVATHRHRDHISGFARQNGKGPGEVIRNLKPDVVVQPWTEDPDAATNATTPTRVEQVAAFQKARISMAAVARAVVDESVSFRGAEFQHFGERLGVIGMDNIANPDAVENLRTMAKKKAYVHYGSRSGLERVLPGVKLRVLGPPTLAQDESIRKQRSSDADEFWMLQAQFWDRQRLASSGLPAARGRRAELRRRRTGRVPPSARWFIERMKEDRSNSLLSIVRVLDNAMNNTSVILLFEIGSRLLLFPGDAQYENWMYALHQPGILPLLANVDLYKVGHHGSRNATPKTLWNNFKKATPTRQLQTVLSTLSGVHGESEATRVPRATLLEALSTKSRLTSTEDFKPDELRESVTMDL